MKRVSCGMTTRWTVGSLSSGPHMRTRLKTVLISNFMWLRQLQACCHRKIVWYSLHTRRYQNSMSLSVFSQRTILHSNITQQPWHLLTSCLQLIMCSSDITAWSSKQTNKKKNTSQSHVMLNPFRSPQISLRVMQMSVKDMCVRQCRNRRAETSTPKSRGRSR